MTLFCVNRRKFCECRISVQEERSIIMSVTKSLFGKTEAGQEVFVYRLQNRAGSYIEVLDYGAILRSVVVPDKDGNMTDVVLGYDSVAGYENGTCFFGATIGRSGNRIAGGTFEIDGVTYQMAQNENNNNLHSGPDGYEKRIWTVKEIREEENSVTFALNSPDKDQGFPGNFDILVKYEMSEVDEVIIHYMGNSDKDTVANLTNHSYFNPQGHDSGSNSDILLKINADNYTPVADSASIPTGEIASVKGTPMDFTEEKPIGKEIDADFEQLNFTGGYDHNYVLNGYEKGIERVVAKAYAPKTGISMEVTTDLPGVQFYAANFVENEQGKNGAVYGKRSAFCLETQYFPDSINQKNFESPILEQGETYNTVTIYRFSVE